MKVQTWVPEKRPIARTLADVPSSREKPVLCWYGESRVCAFVENELCLYLDGNSCHLMREDVSPSDCSLYGQLPPAPKTLDEVPDRWIVGSREALWFKDSGKWHSLISWRPASSFEYRPQTWPSEDNWQLTDHIAVLKETEIEVIG